ncbi:MAG TPA: TRAM domain-containing protein, partial [Candidatus Saccharimonadales bacterium]|nr:TRAM domain-containing protein [Candidatus Saccharimonadales bacterium]
FEDTLSLCAEVGFDQAFIFRYSPRRDTPAAALPDQLPEEVKEERNQRLLALINELAARKYAAYVGARAEILVEGPSRKNPNRLSGRTRTNKIVVFEGAPRHLGQVMDVQITHTGSFTLYGDPAVLGFS